MAHTAVIGALVEDLVRATVETPSESQLEQYKRAALRTFAASQTGRVNQFDVHARLQGLVEKARILNNDPLADALHLRLVEVLPRSDRWTPEILSLLLHLSDRPVHNSKVGDLILLEPGPSSAPLDWSDIVADDPIDNQDGIWDNVDFAGDASDEEEVFCTDGSDTSELSLGLSPVDEESIEAKREDLVLPTSGRDLHPTVDAQFWRLEARVSSTDDSQVGKHKAPKLLLTEIQTMREVMFMLLGLPTTVFTFDANDHLAVSSDFAIRHVSPASIISLLQQFARIGDQLRIVRRWTRGEMLLLGEQAFQAAIESRLEDLDLGLNEIQVQILRPHTQSMSSLLQLYNEIHRGSQFIQQTASILVDLKPARPFGILESLYEKTCAIQSIGDTNGYEDMARLFFECFRAYIKPVQLWMETGQLSGHDQVMFIRKKEGEVPLTSLWNDQYHLIRQGNDILYAPNFLHIAVKKIFSTGKSVNFLRLLGHDGKGPEMQTLVDHVITFEDVCHQADFDILSPFAELFNMALDTLIARSFHSSALLLRNKLEAECGLWRALDALEYIYFFRNGALSTDIALKIFQRIDHGNARWNDSFALTELFQQGFSTVTCIDVDSLDVRSKLTVRQGKPYQVRRSMGALEDLRVGYRLPWPIANVVKLESFVIYQQILILLMQLHRAKYLLQMRKLQRNASTAKTKDLVLVYGLRHRLLWLTDIMLTYITDVVLVASTNDMRSKIMRAEDVDDMIAVHEAYIDKIQDECLFTKQHSPIHRAIVSLLDLTVLFSDIQASYAMQTTLPRSEAMQTRQRNVVDPDSGDDEDDDYGSDDADDAVATSSSDITLSYTDRLKDMSDTFRKLHSYVTAAAQGMSKDQSVACWEILATSLATGLEK